MERDYQLRASQIKEQLMASGAFKPGQDIASIASESLNERDSDDDYNYPASQTQTDFLKASNAEKSAMQHLRPQRPVSSVEPGRD